MSSTIINTGLLSFGMSGRVFHAPFLTVHPGFKLKAVVERSKKTAAQLYPGITSYNAVEELLADKEIQLVVVNTPVDTHFEFVKQALLAGKHALVEKAFTTTVAEAETLRDLAKQKGLSLTVYQNRRWDSDFKTVQHVLQQNWLSEIVEAEIRFDRYNPALSPKAWKETGSAGTGVLMDLGSHIIDQALTLFGVPQAVSADLRKTREHSLIDDNIDILLYYPDKRVRLHAGMFNREALPGYVLQGRNGSFLKPRADVQEDTLKEGVVPNTTTWGTEPAEKAGMLHTEINGVVERKTVPTLKGNYYDLFEGVYQSVAHGKPEIVPAQDGVNVMRIIEAAKQSSEQKEVVEL